MERRIITVLLIGLMGILSGCTLISVEGNDSQNEDLTISITVEQSTSSNATATPIVGDYPKKDLLYMFSEKNDADVLQSFYGDFNHDGIHEMFVISGEKLMGPIDEQENIYGQLWYVDSRGVQLAAEDFSGVVDNVEIWEFEDRNYLVAQKAYLTGNLTYFWSVENYTPKKHSASGLGDIRYEDGQLKAYEITNDAMLENDESKGQTVKSYDMFYNNGFFEYGAVVISPDRFSQYSGADEIMAKLNTDYPGASLNILYHDNHVIYINIQYEKDMITYQYSAIVHEENNTVQLVNVIEGNYQKALLKRIAIYPSR